MKNISIAAVIVCYYPDSAILQQTIETLKNQTDCIILVDNSEPSSLGNPNRDCVVLANRENLGIASALNQGIRWAHKKDYDFVLLLDQDSRITEGFCTGLLHGMERFSNAALCVPRVVYQCDNTHPAALKQSYLEKKFAITSGSLLRCSFISSIGLMDAALFIDYVDFDYCFRIRKCGKKIIQCTDAVLHQNLGAMQLHRLCGIRFYPTHHSAQRCYYKSRNRAVLWRRYWLTDPRFVFCDFLRFWKELFEILAFEKQKTAKCRAVLLGLAHACILRLGKLQSKSSLFTFS